VKTKTMTTKAPLLQKNSTTLYIIFRNVITHKKNILKAFARQKVTEINIWWLIETAEL